MTTQISLSDKDLSQLYDKSKDRDVSDDSLKQEPEKHTKMTK